MPAVVISARIGETLAMLPPSFCPTMYFCLSPPPIPGGRRSVWFPSEILVAFNYYHRITSVSGHTDISAVVFSLVTVPQIGIGMRVEN